MKIATSETLVRIITTEENTPNASHFREALPHEIQQFKTGDIAFYIDSVGKPLQVTAPIDAAENKTIHWTLDNFIYSLTVQPCQK